VAHRRSDSDHHPDRAVQPLLGNASAEVRSRGWLLEQSWRDLLFAHWPVPGAQLRPRVPQELELDEREGSAWVAVTPFWMTVRPRGLPPFPGASVFPELNLRTYVRHRGSPGVFFFSLDAGSLLAVLGARLAFGLPYFWSRMTVERSGDEVTYRSRRRTSGIPAELSARYAPVGPVYRAPPDSLEDWLTSRYRLFTVGSGGVRTAEIDHEPWPLQLASAEFDRNTIGIAAGITLRGSPPHLLFSRRLDVRIWLPSRR
jgi:uncharacterized protein